jgi:hypothetical protein
VVEANTKALCNVLCDTLECALTSEKAGLTPRGTGVGYKEAASEP